jgi:hypothetical protein
MALNACQTWYRMTMLRTHNEVDGHSLVDVRRDQVIISRNRAGRDSRWSHRRLLEEALYSSDILPFLRVLERPPKGVYQQGYSRCPDQLTYHSLRTIGLRHPPGFAADAKHRNCNSNDNSRSVFMLNIKVCNSRTSCSTLAISPISIRSYEQQG